MKKGRKRGQTQKQKIKKDLGKEQLKRLKEVNPVLYKILLRK